MENASKALIMAGEILLGVIILSLLIYFFSNTSNYTHTYQKIKDVEEINKFNKNFERYMISQENRSVKQADGSYTYENVQVTYTIQELATIINFAKNYNKDIEDEEEQRIQIQINNVDYTKKPDDDIIGMIKTSNSSENPIKYRFNDVTYFGNGMVRILRYTTI